MPICKLCHLDKPLIGKSHISAAVGVRTNSPTGVLVLKNVRHIASNLLKKAHATAVGAY